MLVHSIIPTEYLMEEDTSSPASASLSIVYSGCAMEVQQQPSGWLTVTRVISSDPEHYLRYQPGTVIPVIPQG